MTSDPFTDIRGNLHAAINDTIAGLEFSHSALLGQRVSALMGPEAEETFLPALLCAFAARSLGAEPEAALAAATAVALVEASARVVDDLVIAGSGGDVEPRGLITQWGVPRTLNAADAFFALANEALLRLGDLGYDPAAVLAIADELSEGCRAWSEESDARLSAGVLETQHPSHALLSAATRIGALTARFQGDLDALSAGIVDNDRAALWSALPPSAAPPFADAATYLAGVPRT